MVDAGSLGISFPFLPSSLNCTKSAGENLPFTPSSLLPCLQCHETLLMVGVAGHECILWSHWAPGTKSVGSKLLVSTLPRRGSGSGLTCGSQTAARAGGREAAAGGVESGPVAAEISGGSPLIDAGDERQQRKAKAGKSGGGQVKKLPNNNKFPKRR